VDLATQKPAIADGLHEYEGRERSIGPPGKRVNRIPLRNVRCQGQSGKHMLALNFQLLTLAV
jgi:hypothetical protein